MRSVLPDGEYDISMEDMDLRQLQNQNTYKTPPNDQESFCELRSPRSNSKLFGRTDSIEDDCVENDVPVKIFGQETLNNDSEDTSLNHNTTKNRNVKKKSKKRKLSCQEMAESLLDTIDTNAIADMLAFTDINKGKESQSVSYNSPNKNVKRVEKCKRRRKETQTENCYINFENGADISLVKTDHDKELNRKVSNVKDTEELFPRKRRNSIKAINSKTTKGNSSVEENIDIELKGKDYNMKEVKVADETSPKKRLNSIKAINNVTTEENFLAEENSDMELKGEEINVKKFKDSKEYSIRKRQSSIEVTNNVTTFPAKVNYDIELNGKDINTEKFKDISLAKTDHDQELNGKVANIKDTKKLFPKKRRNSIKAIISKTTEGNSPAGENIDVEFNEKDISMKEVKDVDVPTSRNSIKVIKYVTTEENLTAEENNDMELNRKEINMKEVKDSDDYNTNNVTTLPAEENNVIKLNGKEINMKEAKEVDENSSRKRGSSIEVTNTIWPAKENYNIELNETVSNLKKVQETEKISLRKTRSLTKNCSFKENSPTKENNKIGEKISNEVLKVSTTKPGNANSILKYFAVQNKQNEKEAKCKKSPKKQKTLVQRRSERIPDTCVSNNLNLNKTNTESNKQNSMASNAKDAEEPVKRGRGRPRLATQRVNKINLSRPIGVKRYTKISKLTKAEIKKVGSRKIPKERLDDALNMIDDDNHAIWNDRNISCNPCIFLHWNPRSSLNSDQNIKIKYARQFLLRRDWISLSKVLGLFNATSKGYYPLLTKYATLLLAHTDKEQFNKFIQFLTKFSDSSAVMKKCTKMTTANEE